MTGSGEDFNDWFRITSIMSKKRVIFSSTDVEFEIVFGKSFFHFYKWLENVEMSKINTTICTSTSNHYWASLHDQYISKSLFLWPYDIA